MSTGAFHLHLTIILPLIVRFQPSDRLQCRWIKLAFVILTGYTSNDVRVVSAILIGKAPQVDVLVFILRVIQVIIATRHTPPLPNWLPVARIRSDVVCSF